jgi:hypothetical protein
LIAKQKKEPGLSDNKHCFRSMLLEVGLFGVAVIVAGIAWFGFQHLRNIYRIQSDLVGRMTLLEAVIQGMEQHIREVTADKQQSAKPDIQLREDPVSQTTQSPGVDASSASASRETDVVDAVQEMDKNMPVASAAAPAASTAVPASPPAPVIPHQHGHQDHSLPYKRNVNR